MKDSSVLLALEEINPLAIKTLSPFSATLDLQEIIRSLN